MIEELNNASQSLAWLPYAILFIPIIVSLLGTSYLLYGSATRFLSNLSDSFVSYVFCFGCLMFVISLYFDLKIRFGKGE